ncbi:MAG: hypothetical protein JNK11_08625 [Alphaproteobacteria bacterium]|nr:hypothetical protein [Alphaproteobacteria bacterium]
MADKQGAVTRYRRRQRGRGLLRVELQAAKADAALLRRAAQTLRADQAAAARVRAALVAALASQTGAELLRGLAAPESDDALADWALARDKSPSRDVEL